MFIFFTLLYFHALVKSAFTFFSPLISSQALSSSCCKATIGITGAQTIANNLWIQGVMETTIGVLKIQNFEDFTDSYVLSHGIKYPYNFLIAF